MGRRLQALLGKELREHWLAALGLCLLFGLGYVVLLIQSVVAQRTVTILEAQLYFLWTFLPLGALLLGNRLVVVEWYGRTQLFVEALPLRRGEMVAVKFVLGLVLLESVASLGLGLAVLLALRTEPVDARFLEILEARGSVYVLCVWATFFALGFLGRLRLPIYVFGILGLLGVSSLTELEISHFGPFALVSHRTFPYERTELPVEDLLTTGGIALAWIVLAFALALLREGSVAEVLSQRMSQKEKVTIGVLVVAALMAMTALDKRKTKAPYDFTDKAVLRSETLPIAVLYVSDERLEDGRALLAALEKELASIQPILEVETLPPIRIAYSSSFDAHTFDTAKLEDKDGVLVRGNFARGPGADPGAIEAYVLREVVDKRTRGRAHFEPKRWVHDGFARWWVESSKAETSASLVLRALSAARMVAPGVAALDRWTLTRERLGEPLAEALAWSGLRALEEARGSDAVLRLARELFGRDVPEDVRELFHERANPAPVVFERATGVSYPDFIELWKRWLEKQSDPTTLAALEQVPLGKGELSVLEGDGRIRSIQDRFVFEHPPRAGTPCALVHERLGPFDAILVPKTQRREEHLWPGDGAIPTFGYGGYSADERVFLALEVDSAVLGCPIRLLAERRELP